MIVFDGVTTWRDDRPVLDDVSLTVRPGEFVLIVGANGAGKTTLLQHVNGIQHPDRGEVRIDGTAVRADPAAARQAVGMVFQDPRDQLVAATVADDVAFGPENLGLTRSEIDDRVDDALAAVGMTGLADRRVDGLSHGERTRVAIAGALAMQPDYLALDEPLVGLDMWGRKAVLDRVLARYRDGTAILLATHDVADLYGHADRIIGLSDGGLVLDAPPEKAIGRLPGLGVRAPSIT